MISTNKFYACWLRPLLGIYLSTVNNKYKNTNTNTNDKYCLMVFVWFDIACQNYFAFRRCILSQKEISPFLFWRRSSAASGLHLNETSAKQNNIICLSARASDLLLLFCSIMVPPEEKKNVPVISRTPGTYVEYQKYY